MVQKSVPRVFILDPARLYEVRERIREGDKELLPAWHKLKQEAAESLSAGPFTVVDKPVTPPSGDKHDYMSIAPYWWPNPDTPSGLPYIRKDGEENPERSKLDRSSLAKLSAHTDTLALAYYFSDEEAFALKAAELLRAWFIDEPTRMNPHLHYGQSIRGICDGRGIGIIETRDFLKVVNAIGLLQGSSSWANTDQSQMQAWFKQYLHWLLDSERGRDEASQANNHGTHYDVQVAVFSLFVGQEDVAKEILSSRVLQRITDQIEPDGRQPLELARTKALSYSSMNLDGWFDLAAIAEVFGIDLLQYTTADGRGLRMALDYLVPYFSDPESWPYEQIHLFSSDQAMKLLRRGANAFKNAEYEQAISRLSGLKLTESRIQLLYPRHRHT
ncbi:alginate lyase family protein [Paenibacillus cremeus]|uniref:alginate lyase family protein n=1 Tax=Paenibacillus cremeus TaxID=2163881 RepID=UPI001644328C|nr:alginate lyase family protein [Paenibacillus cremeus]